MCDQSESITKLAPAIVKMQSAVGPALKDGVNPHFRASYASMASMVRATGAILRSNGLAVIQTTEPSEAGIILVTTLMHESGEWIRGKLFLPPQKKDPQGFGAAITYARRYAYSAICGLCETDNVAEAGPSQDDEKAPTCITDEQVVWIKSLIKAAESTPELFCDWFGSGTVEGIHATAYERAVEVLQAKVDKLTNKED